MSARIVMESHSTQAKTKMEVEITFYDEFISISGSIGGSFLTDRRVKYNDFISVVDDDGGLMVDLPYGVMWAKKVTFDIANAYPPEKPLEALVAPILKGVN